MAKLALAACVVLALFALAAEATTIEVTNGRLSMYQLGLFDTCFFTSTPALSANTCLPSSFQLMPPLGASHTVRLNAPFVFIDGVRYDSPPPNGPPPFGVPPFNLVMVLLHAPVSDMPLPAITLPFMMTGTLDLLDPITHDPITFDLIGQGTLRCCRQPDPLGTSIQLVAVEFNFEPGATSVPEPSSLLLLTAAAPLLVSRWGRTRTT